MEDFSFSFEPYFCLPQSSEFSGRSAMVTQTKQDQTMNAFSKKTKSTIEYKQEPPFCIQIEFVEGCNLRCTFCGINGIRTEDQVFKYMDVSTLKKIVNDIKRLNWNCRIEIAMHGEPTMHPNHVEFISIIRDRLPNAYILMESNGRGIVLHPAESVANLFKAGLSTLAIDEYEGVNYANRIFTALADNPMVMNYPSGGKEGNPHQRSSSKRLVRIEPISLSSSGTHSHLSNHAGAAAPLDHSTDGKRCTMPFREMSIRWDGSVAVCCNDWRGVLPMGNVMKTPLDKIWNGDLFNSVRKFLYQGWRLFPPCKGCSHVGNRVGLLPDKMGQVELEPPTDDETDAIEYAQTFGPLTAPVLRAWESNQ